MHRHAVTARAGASLSLVNSWQYRLLLALGVLLTDAGTAAAFPFLDATNQDQVPAGTELSAPDTQNLMHQLQLVDGLAPPPGGGWTFVPRIDVQEELTDNILQQHSPRQADLVTYVAPSISVAGDVPRLKLDFSLAPILALYANTSSLNQLSEQMNGLASVTVVPDLFYVDIRGVSGLQSQYGSVGGLGTLGASVTGASATGIVPGVAGNMLGLTRDNEVQTGSFAVSPYLLHRFGDWGTAKLGYSLAMTRSDFLSGFTAPPIPTGGANGQTLVTNEEIAHYDTGDALSRVNDSIDIDLSQAQSSTDSGFPLANGLPAPSHTSTQSTRALLSDTVTYQLNRAVAVFGSGGHEDITYTGQNLQSIHDLTWSLGTTLTPNADSLLTVSYGHLNGINSLSVNGHYAVTARTMLSVSYGTTLGTQLQLVQNQLNLATAGTAGNLVNAQTGGVLFGPSGAFAVQDGVFRTRSLVVGSQTSLDRDIISLNAIYAVQSNTGAGNNLSTTSTTASASWVHQMRPDMTLSAAVSLSWQNQPSSVGLVPDSSLVSGTVPGNSLLGIGSLTWQYQISETITTSVRYSLLNRHSAVAGYSMLQNIFILGLTKTF